MIVYKYTTNIKILEGGSLRFTQPDELNDPFETRPNFEEVIEDIKRENIARYGPASAAIISAGIDHNMPQIIAGMINAMNSGIGILSLTKKRNNLLMWSHYAASHTGFTLGFDGGHQFFRRDDARRITGLREVKYSPDRAVVPGDAATVAANPHVLGEIFFFTKSSDWAYEEELRVMAELESADDKPRTPGGYGVCLFKFPPECLREIIFGARTPEPLKQEIRKIAAANYPHAQLLQASISETKFDLDITNAP